MIDTPVVSLGQFLCARVHVVGGGGEYCFHTLDQLRYAPTPCYNNACAMIVGQWDKNGVNLSGVIP